MDEKFSQADRVFRAETPLSGKEELLLEAFSGVEGVSRPYKYTLEFVSQSPSIDPDDILRKPVAVFIQLADGSERVIHGVASRFTQRGRSEELSGYEAEIVPWFWFLSLSTDCRIFQTKTVLEIIEEVFGEYGSSDFDVRCTGSYDPREYCVQYRETDLDFVSRLMEEEGIFYFFEHSGSGHKLVLADDASAISPCVQERARFSGTPGGWLEEDVIAGLEKEHVVHPTKVTLTDYDPLQPTLNLQSSAVKQSEDEIYDYPGKFSKTKDGERYSALRLEELSTLEEVLRGSSDCRAFESGRQFALIDYYRQDANDDYLLLSVEHVAKGGGYRSGPGEAHYSNRFECIPVKVPYRPSRRAPKQLIRGSQTAVVVGPGGEEIYTDKHGRVKVQFHWDRKGGKDENSSCWIRVSQPWAGKNWGAVAIPRIGQEVIVDFLEGDPDRPIITGRVYNAKQVPPYNLPGNKTQTGMKSRSSKGGDGATFNEISMEDKKGEELLYLHAEKDKKVIVENNNSESVGNDETISIGHSQALTVGKDRTETVDHDHEETIGSNMTLTVGSDREMTVGSDLDETVGGDMTLTVGSDGSTKIGSDLSVTVGKNGTVTIGKKGTLKVGDVCSVQAKKIQIKADDEISIKVGSASITMKKSGDVEIKGKAIKMQGSSKVDVKAGGKITLKGAQVAQN
jgi:type VI secretion system secreted protein VgrG